MRIRIYFRLFIFSQSFSYIQRKSFGRLVDFFRWDCQKCFYLPRETFWAKNKFIKKWLLENLFGYWAITYRYFAEAHKVVKTTIYVSRRPFRGKDFFSEKKLLNYEQKPSAVLSKLRSTFPEKHFATFSYGNFIFFSKVFFLNWGESLQLFGYNFSALL